MTLSWFQRLNGTCTIFIHKNKIVNVGWIPFPGQLTKTTVTNNVTEGLLKQFWSQIPPKPVWILSSSEAWIPDTQVLTPCPSKFWGCVDLAKQMAVEGERTRGGEQGPLLLIWESGLKSWALGSLPTWVQIPALPVISCVILGTWRFNGIMYVKHLECSWDNQDINVSYYHSDAFLCPLFLWYILLNMFWFVFSNLRS